MVAREWVLKLSLMPWGEDDLVARFWIDREAFPVLIQAKDLAIRFLDDQFHIAAGIARPTIQEIADAAETYAGINAIEVFDATKNVGAILYNDWP